MAPRGSLPPTPRRLRRAQREGDVPRSSVLLALGAMLGAMLTFPMTVARLRRGFTEALGQLDALSARPEVASALLETVVEASLPVLLGAFVGAGLAAAVPVGGRYMPSPMGGGSKRDPRDEPSRRALRALAALGAGTLLLWVAASGLDASTRSVTSGLARAVAHVEHLAWLGLACLAAVALADALLARRGWWLRMLMTPAERRDEARQARGGHPGGGRRRSHREREPRPLT